MLLPGAAPDGRAVLNRPPTYTVFPTTSWVHTTPLTWTVGRASAVTPAEPRFATALVPAWAGVGCAAPPATPTRRPRALASTTATASLARTGKADVLLFMMNPR